MKNGLIIEYGNKYWYKDDLLHREGDLPAIEYSNGTKYWYSFDKNGKITDIPTTENTGVPYMVWQGRWEEGIASTFIAFLKAGYEGVKKGGFADAKNIIDITKIYYTKII